MITVEKYFAQWCVPCKSLTPVLEGLSRKLPEVEFLNIDVDNFQEKAAELGIRSVPTVIIKKDGQVVDRIQGVNPEAVYLSKIQAA